MFFFVQAIAKRKFDAMYGLYHILLDRKLKEELDSSRQNISELHKLHLDTPQRESQVEEDLSKFLPSKPMKLEIEEGREDELSRYLGRRRGTIAVSHFKQNTEVNDSGIPEISICRSPSPTNDKSELQYKEKYLPRPTVLKVRPTFDRRASDGSATLQDSIAQFNLNWNHSKSGRRNLPKESSRNMLSVPENDAAGSESDTEHEAEVSSYLHGRGGRRRTLPCFPTTPENEDVPSKIFRAVKPPRASPTPYLPLGGADPRIRELIPNVKKPLDVFGEHKQLQDQFNPTRRSSSSNHVRENPYRHSYPFRDIEPAEERHDPGFQFLRKKQEAELADLDVQFAVRRKLLETKMEQERAEFIRRASEGANNLESSIAAFNLKYSAASPAANSSSPQASPVAESSLQDEMKKLNLMASPCIGGELPSFNVNTSFQTRSMDVDEEAQHQQQNATRFNRYPKVPPLFTSHSPSESVTRPNPFVPNFRTSNMRPSFPGMDSPLLHDPFRPSSQELEHDPLDRSLSYDMILAQSMNSIAERVKLSLEDASVEYSQSGDNYFSLYKDGIQMEIEIYPGHELNKHMVKFRRVGGEVWPYKKLRERIVNGLCA